jgi:ribosomal protein S15P/S13E
MSKYDIFGKDYEPLASDRLIENAEAMLVLLKHMIAANSREDIDQLIERAKRITNHIETGE